MKEIWKNVVGYERLYEVSNLGRVKRIEREITRKDGVEINVKECIIKSHEDDYEKVMLHKKKKKSFLLVHRLVADSFLENINNYKYVTHLDGNNMNNALSNIEWSEKKQPYRKKLCERYVNYIKENVENLSISELASMFSVNERTIKMYLNENT